VPTSNRPDLFIQKLEQCNVIFDFRDPSMDIRSKEIKRSTLQELLEYISNNRNVIQVTMYGRIVSMVRSQTIGLLTCSSPQTSSVQFLLPPIPLATCTTLKKMNLSWKPLGPICKLSMSSFYVS
jgi:Protein phosphatase 2A regulatory B subunit (B56 family)